LSRPSPEIFHMPMDFDLNCHPLDFSCRARFQRISNQEGDI
jgi:hypothetical protein